MDCVSEGSFQLDKKIIISIENIEGMLDIIRKDLIKKKHGSRFDTAIMLNNVEAYELILKESMK